jgi:hypothetical protein
MTLKEALDEVIAHPCKRALRSLYGLLYYDPTFGNDCFCRSMDGEQGELELAWSAVGFGAPLFTIDEIISSDHVVVDVDFPPYKP